MAAAVVSQLLLWTVSPAFAAYPRPAVKTTLGSADGKPILPASAPAVSGNGRFVAFMSRSSNVVPGDDNDLTDVFVYDRNTGRIELVSGGPGGEPAQGQLGAVNSATMSADGRYVAFSSGASNLVPGDTNGTPDVFIHDRSMGTTEAVSVDAGGRPIGGGGSLISLTPDGRYVAFQKEYPSGGAAALLRDRQTGTTEIVSVRSDGTPMWMGVRPQISPDGRYVAFQGREQDAADGPTKNQIFVRDRLAGVTELISANLSGQPGSQWSNWPFISADGRFVTFTSVAPDLVPNASGGIHVFIADGVGAIFPERVYVRDRLLDTTELVSVGPGGEPLGPSDRYRAVGISSDGRLVFFHGGPYDGRNRPYVHDRLLGLTDVVDEGPRGLGSWMLFPGMSASDDGRVVAYNSIDPDVPSSSEDFLSRVFVIDRGVPLGAAGVGAAKDDGALRITGRATFSGAVLAQAQDPRDGHALASQLSAELTGFKLAYRVEHQDLYARLELASLTGLGCQSVVCPVTAFGDPGVVYGIGFTIGDTRYDLRFTRVMASIHPPEANIGDPIRPSTSGFFRMYYTRPTIPPMAVELIPIDGGLGVVGRAITFRVPLVDVEAKPGDELRQVRAYTWIAQDSAAEPAVLLDEIAGPDSVQLSPASVAVGLAPKGQEEAPASFSKASLHHGLFEAAFPAFEDGSGLDAWIRTCIGEECVVTRQRL